MLSALPPLSTKRLRPSKSCPETQVLEPLFKKIRLIPSPLATPEKQVSQLKRHLERRHRSCLRQITQEHPKDASFIELVDPLIYFARLLEIPGPTETPHSFILGDADGSLGRMMLLAIQSGHFHLDDKGLSCLSDVLYEEFLQLGIPGSLYEWFHPAMKPMLNYYPLEFLMFKSFQSNGRVALNFETILRHGTYSDASAKLIFLGDILHDRLSNHKSAMLSFIKNLHAHGAIFIKGNHDYGQVCLEFCEQRQTLVAKHVAFGRHCLDNGFTGENKDDIMQQWMTFEKKYFQNTFYDEDKKIFYIHNGFSTESRPPFRENFLFTAFQLPFRSKTIHTPKELEKKLNYTRKDAAPLKDFEKNHLTGFRPSELNIQQTLEGFFPQQGITCIHGHEGFATHEEKIIAYSAPKTESIVLNVNSRSKLNYQKNENEILIKETHLPIAIRL